MCPLFSNENVPVTSLPLDSPISFVYSNIVCMEFFFKRLKHKLSVFCFYSINQVLVKYNLKFIYNSLISLNSIRFKELNVNSCLHNIDVMFSLFFKSYEATNNTLFGYLVFHAGRRKSLNSSDEEYVV